MECKGASVGVGVGVGAGAGICLELEPEPKISKGSGNPAQMKTTSSYVFVPPAPNLTKFSDSLILIINSYFV